MKTITVKIGNVETPVVVVDSKSKNEILTENDKEKNKDGNMNSMQTIIFHNIARLHN